jgi:hypothetical protein
MPKIRSLRVLGFVGALTVSAALVATTAATTGAYFSDSKDGSFTATAGHLKLNLAAGTTMNMNFDGLMPGTDQVKKISYTVDVSSGGADIWLVFPNANVDPSPYQAFTGPKSNVEGGGLGRYGHFAVANNGHIAFQSYNLQLPADPASNKICTYDQWGDGGSAVQATSPTDTPEECGVPNMIRLATGVTTGGEVEITFGLTGRQTQQDQQEFGGAAVPFQIVATQPNIKPGQANF